MHWTKLAECIGRLSCPFSTDDKMLLGEVEFTFTGLILESGIHRIFRATWREIGSKWWYIGVGPNSIVEENGDLIAVLRWIDSDLNYHEEKITLQNISDRKELQRATQRWFYGFSINSSERIENKWILGKIGKSTGILAWTEILRKLGAIEIERKVYGAMKAYNRLMWEKKTYSTVSIYANCSRRMFLEEAKKNNYTIVNLPYIVKLDEKNVLEVWEKTPSYRKDSLRASLELDSKTVSARISKRGTSVIVRGKLVEIC